MATNDIEQDAPRAAPERSSRAIAPEGVALAVIALMAVLAAHAAAGSYVEARAAGAFTPTGKRLAALALILNGAVLVGGLALLAGEIASSVARACRKRSDRLAFLRVAVMAVPLAILAGGHAALNPWMGAFAKGVARLAWIRVTGGGAPE